MNKTQINKLSIRIPDDMHVHLRRDQMLINVLPFTAYSFGRAMVKGNFNQRPIIDAGGVENYRNEILTNVDTEFNPIMSIMFVKSTTPRTVAEANEAGARVLALIPGKTSTGSDDGIALTELKKYYSVLKTVCQKKMIFSIHLELVETPEGNAIKEPERERLAIPFLKQIIKDIPGLKIVAEHVTTKELINFIKQAPDNVSATLTAHHAVLTRKDVFNEKGKIINPHNYCKPVAKTKKDRLAVTKAMTSGNPKFFFGSDSAPHPISKKMGDNPPAGIFSAPVALPLLCEIFDRKGKLNGLENFVSRFGARFYNLPLNRGKITLVREKWIVPFEYAGVGIFKAGETINWSIED